MEVQVIDVQKTIIAVGRITFVVAVLAVGVMTLVVSAISFNYKDGGSEGGPLWGRVGADGVVLASSNNNVESLGEVSPNESFGSAVAADARVLLVENYLKRYKSPLVPYSKLIVELSDTYGFDYYWIVAIGQQESNLCKKIPENSFNCWGYGIHARGTLRFESYEIALKSYAEYLKRAYFDKGLDTPELIMRKYCPSSNGSWAFGVKQFIREIESGEF